MEAGDVSEVENGSFGNMVDMGEEGESGVKDNSKVTDLGRGGNGGAVNVKGEVLSGVGEGVRTKDEDFGLVGVEFEKVILHPGLNVSQTGGEG